jgi:hypothetical protein
VNKGVDISPRGQISSLGAKFTPRGEVRPWEPGVKLRMALWKAAAADPQKVNYQKNASQNILISK